MLLRGEPYHLSRGVDAADLKALLTQQSKNSAAATTTDVEGVAPILTISIKVPLRNLFLASKRF